MATTKTKSARLPDANGRDAQNTEGGRYNGKAAFTYFEPIWVL